MLEDYIKTFIGMARLNANTYFQGAKNKDLLILGIPGSALIKLIITFTFTYY
jgi:hypothetical protein